MALPEHIKKLALDAVGNSDTIQWIRQHSGYSNGGIFNGGEREQGMTPGLKQKADAIMAASPMLKNIRLESVAKVGLPLPTPSRQARRMTQAVMGLYASGQSMNDIHQALTSDDFGRAE